MIRFLVLALSAMVIAGPTVADHGRGKGCPPGLAKKDPPCIPPGLAKKGVGHDHDDDDDDDERRIRVRRIHDGDGLDRDDIVVIGPDGRIYAVGDRLDRRLYRPLTVEELVLLPLLQDGRRYVRVDNQIVEVMEATDSVVRSIGLVSDLFR